MGRLQNNPSIGWVNPKSTHTHPLAWTDKKLTCKPLTLSIQPTFDSLTPIPAQKVVVIDLFVDHQQLSHVGFPMDDALVSAGSHNPTPSINQQPPVQHEGWMVHGQETFLHQLSVL
jgi:hypothetical protein